METTNARMQLVVSSRKVLARVEKYDVSFRTWDGQLHVNSRTMSIYDYVFDEGQSRALKEAQELARRSGLTLEVTDLSRQSAFRRMITQGIGVIDGLSGRGPKTLPIASETLGKHQEGCEDVISPVSRP